MKYEDTIENNDQVTRANEEAVLYGTANANMHLCINDNKPYTIEELDARLEQAEEDFNAGRYFSNESVIKELNLFVQAL